MRLGSVMGAPHDARDPDAGCLMTRAVPFTQARMERAIKAAKKLGMRVILRPDGTMILEKAPDDPQNDPDHHEEKSEVVL
jgi:hypothetical protein